MGEKEIWKDIDGYNGDYQISNFGNVKSLKNNKEKLIKPFFTKSNKEGYLIVNLCKNNKRKINLVHRLVAEAFIPNPNNFPMINHKDENKLNNHVNNLEWCNSKYNNNYGTLRERMKEKLSYKVAKYDLNGNLIKIYNSAHEAAKENNIDQGGISLCCRKIAVKKDGKIQRHLTYKGFKWEYLK